MKKLKITALSAGIAYSLLASTNVLANTSYNNLFISYTSPQDVASLASFAASKDLGGYIMWETKGDVDPSDTTHSLLDQLDTQRKAGRRVSTYWTNWSVYGASAIPYAPYRIPGSKISGSSELATNKDLEDKLAHSNGLVYSFLEAQTGNDSHAGTLYFNDPWADLTPTDTFCTGNTTSEICTYAVKPGKTFADSAFMGNFEAFSQLPQSHPNLETAFAVGGYGHNDTFEKSFTSNTGISNFVNSAKEIMDNYNIKVIDLDYEDPNMSHEQSQNYLNLITELNNKLQDGQEIDVTVLANPDYLNGTLANNQGFAPGVLSQIAKLSHVRSINLMTYDFHGAFDYNNGQASSDSGRTGFLSNIYTPNNTPKGYNARFSVESSVQAILNQGIDPKKVAAGIPAYGRALAGIDANSTQGLFSIIPQNASIPRGDLDDPACTTNLSMPLSPSACSGSFTYQYIVKHMLSPNSSMTEKSWSNDSENKANGTTAYASNWAPPAAADYSLEVSNLSPATGIQITVGDTKLDYLQPAGKSGSDKTYNNSTNPSISSLQNKQNITVTWNSYKGDKTCSSKLNLTADAHIMINDDTSACDIKHTQ